MKELSESQQMYLKTILYLGKKIPKVRSVDIAQALQVTRPSVCNAIARLREMGFVEPNSGSRIVLTPLGRERARSFEQRSAVIAAYLQSIGVDAELAQETAYRTEHILPDGVLDILRRNIDRE